MNQSNILSIKGDFFNTLGQSRTESCNSLKPNNLVKVNGNGSDLGNQKSTMNRARRKQISRVLAMELIKIAMVKGNSELVRIFRNTFYCLEKLFLKDGKVHGSYCKNRICLVCQANRKSEVINNYYDTIKKWECPCFVTLTIKAVQAKRLKPVISNMIEGLNRIIGKYKKRKQRGNSSKWMGIKSLECNFNQLKRTYNPHFHLIVNSRETAEAVKREWLTVSKQGWTDEKAQCIIEVTDLRKTLIEVIKYSSKIFTEPDPKNNKGQKGNRKVYVRALYNIMEAMQGHRLFDRFGFNNSNAYTSKGTSKVLVNPDIFNYFSELSDWIDCDSGEKLSDYQPDSGLSFLLGEGIDRDSI